MKDQPDNWIRCYWIIVISLFILLSFILIKEGFGQTPTPSPVPVATPMPEPSSPADWLEWMNQQPTVEEFWLSEYDFPDGDVRPAEKVVQVPGAGCGVLMTRGYIKGPGDYWNQGFVENEIIVTRLFDKLIGIVEPSAYADQIKKAKSNLKFQKKLEKKPKKLKKITWTSDMEIVW